MPKEATTKKDATRRGKDGNAAAKTDEKANDDKDEASGSEEVELEPVKSKKGEPDDNLRRRAEWFQKRTGGGSS
ncbi:MAG: hypothetical protein ACREA9_18245 [Pyrinomonadaceae bacterium]